MELCIIALLKRQQFIVLSLRLLRGEGGAAARGADRKTALLILLIISFLIATVSSVLLVRGARGHSRHYDASKPQRSHVGDVPRVGGLAVLLGSTVTWIVASVLARLGDPLNVPLEPAVAGGWLLAVLPCVLGGAYEDLTQRVPIRLRLLLTGTTAGLACWLLDLSLPRVGVPAVDSLLAAAPWLGVLIAFVAICGLPHAMNIIDGYNGLAGTVAALICLAIAHVALQLGDRQLAAIVLSLAAASFGFLIWNYPRGLIFAGDGGAYLWGVIIAMASIALVQRHAEVSPWFPMLLLMYPVWETLFSMYRKVVRGQSPGLADRLHFHQLIYRRIVREVFHDDKMTRVLMRNNRTSPYLWAFSMFTVVPAVLFWRHTGVLAAFCLAFAVLYVRAYTSIVRFKVPRYVRRRRMMIPKS